jgi:hypothetical protein
MGITPDLHQVDSEAPALLRKTENWNTHPLNFASWFPRADREANMNLEVDTVREPDGESVPKAFKLGAKSLVVSEIVDRWLASDHSYFKIIADDEDLYILRHDKLAQTWELSLFSRHGTSE